MKIVKKLFRFAVCREMKLTNVSAFVTFHTYIESYAGGGRENEREKLMSVDSSTAEGVGSKSRKFCAKYKIFVANMKPMFDIYASLTYVFTLMQLSLPA